MDDQESISDGKCNTDTLDAQGWITCLGHISRHYGISFSAQSALNSAAWNADRPQAERLITLGRHLGLRIKIYTPDQLELTPWRLPVICELKDGTLGLVVSLSKSGQAGVLLSDEQDEVSLELSDLMSESLHFISARPLRTLVDERVDNYIAPYRKGWLRRFALPDLRPYGYVMIATFTANVLGLTGILFSKQVYDRVVPAESFNTLYVLFIGVMLAAVFDFIMRRTRTKIADTLGKRSDIRLSDQVFGHAMRVKSSARPKSTGSFVSQLRDLESLREMLTSTTITVLADLPFFFMFLFFFWYIGGPLVLVPIVAAIAMILPGILFQKKLNRYVNEGMREASMRNAMLIEAVQGAEDIKTLQAETRFQQRWNHFNAVTAEAQLKQRDITSTLQSWAHAVQMSVFATIVFVGAPMVIAGDMTTGTLVACSLLGSRMMSPMSQFTQIFSKMQQAKLSYKSVDAVMQMPVDHPDRESRIGVSAISGTYHLKGANFFHDEEKANLALSINDLKIDAGEKVAVLGRVGAGKSTLLYALAGTFEPSEGEVLLDDMSLGQIDPSDVRRDVSLLSQDSRLFHGTIRDNLMMGSPQATDKEILEALKISGAIDFVSRMTQGLDYPLLEDGRGLSGGQRQALMLTRLILRNPRVLILDEPTASMDEQTEQNLINALQEWMNDRTVILATHRMRVLNLVDRIIVVERGKILSDESKASFLERSRKASRKTVTKTSPKKPTIVLVSDK
ncbi:type I secretion system permease/ATPase [Lentibacter algarum]|uniref:type I secretion system permease/ATPase n=1 Tax=Lentibacter algarum TaxID=576131 RepID=UPI001C0757DE|nr:type I secretion system permease/ATPase [Lentibacter algarum]MBU2982002.1 type I secretion system permease/ATPase [Lentibacter algarum]